MNDSSVALLPEAILAAAATAGLLAGVWLPRQRQWTIATLIGLACLTGLATTTTISGHHQLVFDGTYAVDTATNLGRVVVLAALLLVIGLSATALRGHRRETEYAVLLALSSVGTLAMVGAADLLTLFAGYLLASVPAYALAGFAKSRTATEAALKYYLLGALLSVVMLAGITLLYAAGHTTSYAGLPARLTHASHVLTTIAVVAVFAGILFKAGAVPAHFWIPDVTAGTPAPVAAFLTTIPKIGGLIAGYRLVHQALPVNAVNWPLLLAVLAAASMTVGNLAAFFQTSPQRLLGYSTISQVGYLLMALAVAARTPLAQPALLYYLAGYAATNLGAFAVVTDLPYATHIRDYRGLARRHPALATVLAVTLLGLVGTPPTAVFVGKLRLFTAAIDGGYTWLAALAVANTIASLFYYLRWLAPALLSTPTNDRPDPLTPAHSTAAITAYAAGIATLALGILAGPILQILSGPLLPD